MNQLKDAHSTGKVDTRASAFVKARLSASGMTTYPGDKPRSLDEAYAIQDNAIDLFPDTLTGWKVGGIAPDLRDTLGVTRLVGPVFSAYTHRNTDTVLSMPVFEAGFAAIEGEVIAVIGDDAPREKTDYTTEDALDLITSMHVGVEIASSPFAEINEHGPLVTISDFGNNRGLILGDEIADWRALELSSWTFRTEINGALVGEAIPDGMPGGPLESVRFALENTARRGRPMQAGMKVLTGAVTGVHQAWCGDEARISFRGGHTIACKLVPLQAD